MARSKSISGVAVAMIGGGALFVYSAIKGTSPLEELRVIMGGDRPEPLSKTSSGSPISSGQGVAAASTSTTGVKGLTGLVPYVARESAYIQKTWRIPVGGFATSGHVTNSDHYTGHALDAMTTNLTTGNAIVAHYKGHPDIKYIIWQHEFWSPERGSRPYTKDDHENHVHLSFRTKILGRIGR